MKKIIVLLAFFVVSSSTIAQIKIRPGVKLGLNNSRLQGLDNAESITGINGGLFVNFDFTRFYELQIETGYSQQGATVNRTLSINLNDPFFTNNRIEEDIDLQYLSLGIANKFFVMAKDHGFHFIVGPSIDIIVNDTNFNSTPIDLSFFGGIGYEFPFGLAIEARYKQGVIDVEDTYDSSTYNDVDYYYTNSVFQIGAAYKFDF
ncbi:porin family protein [uncultured Lacinutrix sp.]|uniref:porin family protein n=1 Tax=uncultured Lacinutrix sp. TaxID=574032 RepID=UPI002621B2D8|nr:porin family protein [uncultured Lacinutrix sp.]